MRAFLITPFLKWASTLRHPTLFKIIALLLLLSVVWPDPLPFLDELILGLSTVLLASWKNRPQPASPAKDDDRVIEGQAKRR